MKSKVILVALLAVALGLSVPGLSLARGGMGGGMGGGYSGGKMISGETRWAAVSAVAADMLPTIRAWALLRGRPAGSRTTARRRPGSGIRTPSRTGLRIRTGPSSGTGPGTPGFSRATAVTITAR